MSATIARCHGCYQSYALEQITVTARYADCDVWRAPCCGREADSRRAWGGPSYRHMGYDDLSELERVRDERLQNWGEIL